jgi:hypothetical protein
MTGWVITPRSPTVPGTSGPGGSPDENNGIPDVIGPKADIDTGMSGLGVGAEVLAYPRECPGLASSGHWGSPG